MNRNRKKAAAATLAAGMAVVLGAGTVMAAASTGDNGLQKEETVYVNTTAGGEVTDVTGVGIGSASHAMGTSKAMEMGEIEGAMSSLSIAVSGLMTVVVSLIFSHIY